MSAARKVRRAHEIQVEPITYVWRDRIPAGMVTVISGRAGEGKSTLTRQMVADVSQTASVIYSNQEDHSSTNRAGLEAAGARLRRVYMPDEPYVLPDDIHALRKKIKETRAKLVVLDSALQHLGPSAGAGQAVRKAITPLKAVLEETGCACIFVDHLIKRPKAGAHPLEALTGSGSGLPAASRAVYIFGINPHNPDERLLAPVKVNFARTDTSCVFDMRTLEVKIASKEVRERTGRMLVEVGQLVLIDPANTRFGAKDVLSYTGNPNAPAAGTQNTSKVAFASEWLTGYLMFGEQKADDVEKDGATAGFSWATLRRAAKQMDVQKTRKGFGKDGAWLWRLPDGHLALQMGAQMQSAGLGPQSPPPKGGTP